MTAAAPETPATVDINHMPATPAAAALYQLCAIWEREAFIIPFVLGVQDPRAQALRDCGDALRETVNGLRRDGEL